MIKNVTLVPGVNLAYQSTKQFKTISIKITFATKASAHVASQRSLLSYLMAVSSKDYPDQRAVSWALIDAYGANFQTRVGSLGDLDLLTLSLEVIQPGILPNTAGLLNQSLDFLQAMIFNFDWESSQADTILKQERQNLKQVILSRQDDKVLLALDEARPLTFVQPPIQESILGTVSELDQLNLKDLKEAHQSLLGQDQVTISLVGDLDFDSVTEQIRSWPWKKYDRQPTLASQADLFAKQPDLLPVGQEKHLDRPDWQQAVLVQNYQTTMNCWPNFDLGYYALLVFNTILGAGPASLLFTEIREKNSLAYNISSRFQPDFSLITVVAGCDAQQVILVEKLIAEQIDQLAAGKISEKMLFNAKETLKNEEYIRQDSPNYLTGYQVNCLLRGVKNELTDFITEINRVTASDIKTVAQTIVKQSQVVLTPKKKE